MDDWIPKVASALPVIVVPIALAYLMRRVTTTARFDGKRTVIEYGGTMKTFALFSAAVPIFFTVSLANVAETDRTIVIAALVLSTALASSLLLEFFGVRIFIDGEGMVCRSPWRRARAIKWSDVGSIRFSPVAQWWVLETRSAGAVRLHVYLNGISHVLEQLKARNIPFA